MPASFNRPLGVLLLVACAPLLLVTALIVLVAMGRPLLFVQLRSGRARETFALLKFRTMSDRRDVQGALLPDVDRTLAAGLWLRRFRLDDLLGLINVVKGNMAIVGPRPLLPATIAAMGPRQQSRLNQQRCSNPAGKGLRKLHILRSTGVGTTTDSRSRLEAISLCRDPRALVELY